MSVWLIVSVMGAISVNVVKKVFPLITSLIRSAVFRYRGHE